MRFRIPDSWKASLRRKQYFDEDLREDYIELLEATALLEIKEYEFFELAYRDWYGRKPLPRVIETHFSNYMFNKLIPTWVRSFARHVLDLEEKGELRPRDLGVYRPLPSKRLIAVGKLFSAVLIIAFLVMMVFIYGHRQETGSLFGRADVNFPIERPSHNAMP